MHEPKLSYANTCIGRGNRNIKNSTQLYSWTYVKFRGKCWVNRRPKIEDEGIDNNN